jgi:hypothetical protein
MWVLSMKYVLHLNLLFRREQRNIPLPKQIQIAELESWSPQLILGQHYHQPEELDEA